MPAKSQRGILRPRITPRDLELREAIVKVFKDLQAAGQPLRQIAGKLQTSEKTIGRYLNDESATLGGDILFRLCEAGYPVACRGQILQCVRSRSMRRPKGNSEQLRFEFVSTIDLVLPARKLIAKVGPVHRSERKRA